jgi:putative transposase
MTLVMERKPDTIPLAVACRALMLNRSTVYERRRRPLPPRPPRLARQHCQQPRALSPAERQEVRDILHHETFCDQPPAQVYARLLEEGRYLCSLSTMHRLLRATGEEGDRRPQRPAQHHAIPRLRATQPNEVWTWDVSKLPTRRRGEYLSLYVVLDLFSRFVVAWMVSRKENSALAKQLFDEATSRYHIAADQLTVHQDRGAPMIAHGYLDLMSELGITCSHSRPRVSNDNAFSESQFKTMKYQPDYPGRFECLVHARQWCDEYFDWYNLSHHHSGLAAYTPEQVFTGRYRDIANTRQQALNEQYQRHPERFVKGPPKASLPPTQVVINPVEADPDSDLTTLVNFPTLAAAGATKNTLSSRPVSKTG